MQFVKINKNQGVGILRLERGKVNAINGEVVQQLSDSLAAFETDSSIKAVLLTGTGSFFSFGFDVPEFLSYTKEAFLEYIEAFTSLYTYMFTYPKPMIAALNGHTIAGGCMLALSCDRRIMVTGKAKISLNEIGFGSSVFAGSVEMLRVCVGDRNAANILHTGAMYSAEEARRLGLVDEKVNEYELMERATTLAASFGEKSPSAYSSIKSLLRKPVAEVMIQREKESINAFLDIWYSDSTWEKIKNIKIH